ncbi:peptidoglycan-binding domain-containing protein [Actinocrispum wychmicini]|uniref:Putative peptidoglycan binding protein n=1 Tax=Actinocrispum wychmicini TaxID=1213861 RepID=A0A4R2K922_9PSEU|nr:peptidoglycan-binding domain-containing protein [Actinocrispum wychmicini]TCO62895.1 putative peptidoglycan binding protein [Actinocrispum wychmicini]
MAAALNLGTSGPAEANTHVGVLGDCYGCINHGHGVWCVQHMLNVLGYHAGAEDSLFGPKTSDAVRLFQQDNVNGRPDGFVGPVTGTILLDTWQDTGHNNGWGGYCGKYLPTTHN